MPDENVVPLKSAARNDSDIARDYKERADKILQQMLTLMREAQRDVMLIEVNFQRDPLGHQFLVGPHVVKRW